MGFALAETGAFGAVLGTLELVSRRNDLRTFRRAVCTEFIRSTICADEHGQDFRLHVNRFVKRTTGNGNGNQAERRSKYPADDMTAMCRGQPDNQRLEQERAQ